jgi:alanine dehydrogenase
VLIGVPKEIKDNEFRVGMTHASVKELTRRGHKVVVEHNAAHRIGIDDADYAAAGATIAATAAEIFAKADMIVKVKEPQAPEIAMLRDGQVLFTYLHLAPDDRLTQGLLDRGIVGVAYETVTDVRGGLPLLAPMSEVAGRMAVHAGANCLEIVHGGRGTLLSGVPGVAAGKVVIIGGGVVGTNAAHIAVAMGARVTVIDTSLRRLAELDFQFEGHITTLYSTVDAIESEVLEADLVVGAVLVPGAETPKLVSRDTVRRMKRGSVLVDVAVDQGGCFETSRPTTHQNPTYLVGEVVHYCVANMPSAVARTAAFALNNATLPFITRLADKGWRDAMREDPHLLAGLNVHGGRITYEAVARSQGRSYVAAKEVVG